MSDSLYVEAKQYQLKFLMENRKDINLSLERFLEKSKGGGISMGEVEKYLRKRNRKGGRNFNIYYTSLRRVAKGATATAWCCISLYASFTEDDLVMRNTCRTPGWNTVRVTLKTARKVIFLYDATVQIRGRRCSS